MEHILILEDEAPLRAAMMRCLRDLPDVEIGAYGLLSEAVESIARRAPSLVVSDIALPDGSGLDLLPELALRGIKVPVVIVSAHLSRFASQLTDGANIEVLAKPFDTAELRRVVQAKLEQMRVNPPPAFAVTDYLQLAGLARRSLELHVHLGTQKLGRILVERGEPRFAEDESGSGQYAFQRLALAVGADVSCRPLVPPLPLPNLSGSLEHQLLEAAQRSDEGARDSQPAFPPIGASTRPPTAVPAPAALGQRPPLPPRPRKPGAAAGAPSERAAAIPVPGSEPSTASPFQEPNVIPIRHKLNLNTVLASDPTLRAVARADRQGSVQDSTGEMDAETACAVALMASRHVGEAADDLGLGRPSAWHVGVASATWYVIHAQESLVVAVGSQGRNPMSTLRKIAKECGL